MANPFRTQSKNPFRQGEITAQPATQESMDAWRDKVMGTAGMDAIGRALVTKAQSAFRQCRRRYGAGGLSGTGHICPWCRRRLGGSQCRD